MAIEKLSVILELITGNYNKNAREAATATGQISGAANSVTGSLRAMLGPAAIAGAVVGFGKMALAAGENADRLFDLAAQTGLSTDELQRWEFVAKAAGATTEVFSDAVKAVIRNLSDAEGATGAAGKAYEALGINVKGANGELREAGEITAEVFDKLAGMENITARNALAQDIFGKKWEETISILDLGSEALSNLREEGERGVVSAEALRNADEFRETWQKFVATVGPKLNEVLGDIAPALTEVAEGAIDALEALEPLIEVVGFLADRYADLKGGLDELETSDNAFLEFLGTAGNMVVGFGGGLGALARGIGLVSGAEDENVTSTDAMTGSWQRATAAITSSTAALEDNAAALAAADDAELSMLRAQQNREETQSRLIELTLAGTASVDELRIAQLELNIATRNAELATDAYLESLDELDGKQVNVRINTLLTFQNIAAEAVEDVFAGGKQHGGPVHRDRSYLVGEAGMELFVPGESGSIVSNKQLMAALGRPNVSGPTINIARPMDNFHQDLQYATILASLTNLVEGL